MITMQTLTDKPLGPHIDQGARDALDDFGLVCLSGHSGVGVVSLIKKVVG